MSALGVLQSVQFVIGTDGHPTAVQIDIKAWNLLLDWLEDNEDRALVKAAIPKLRSGPKRAGALRWEEIRAEWDTLESEAQR